MQLIHTEPGETQKAGPRGPAAEEWGTSDPDIVHHLDPFPRRSQRYACALPPRAPCSTPHLVRVLILYRVGC